MLVVRNVTQCVRGKTLHKLGALYMLLVLLVVGVEFGKWIHLYLSSLNYERPDRMLLVTAAE